MSFDEIIARLQETAGIEDRREAERTFRHVLQALADRLTGKETWDLLAQLPAQVKKSILITDAPLRMSREELVGRIAEELELPREEARERVRAVFAVLREAVTWGELEDVIRQLGPEWADLLA